ncbi:MAG: hypothetical protein DHS20C05_04370 [Hyphococcus sp.]|nr:MAG: hypothetical protein DHS20C05_04370 [Marinicaulis sp.]
MSEFDDMEDGEAGEATPVASPEASEDAAAAAGVDLTATCLSCGAVSVAVFCANCGQKNDDLRRSLFLLARDFVEDTFSFDSRMWRTLGVLVAAPGVVATNYAHGKRSQYTPPVRLFLVVSFIFFLLLSFTQTLFVALEVTELKNTEPLEISFVKNDEPEDEAENTTDQEGSLINCDLKVDLKFFRQASKIQTSQEKWKECMTNVNSAVEEELERAKAEESADASVVEDVDQVAGLIQKAIDGVGEAVADPKAFNDAFNRWLPRVMFLMTPILALILGLFIRGKDALFFDHMVLSLYGHAVGFAIIGAAIFVMQIGVPYVGLAALLGMMVYYTLAIKRAYGRGWIKTTYSTLMSGFFYLLILVSIVIAIVTQIVLQG